MFLFYWKPPNVFPSFRVCIMECKVLCHVLLSLLPTPAVLPLCHLALAELKADDRLNAFMASSTLLCLQCFSSWSLHGISPISPASLCSTFSMKSSWPLSLKLHCSFVYHLCPLTLEGKLCEGRKFFQFCSLLHPPVLRGRPDTILLLKTCLWNK